MEWRPGTHLRIGKLIQDLTVCVHNAFSSEERLMPAHIKIVELTKTMDDTFASIKAKTELTTVYSTLVTVDTQVNDLIQSCQDTVYGSHKSILKSAIELKAFLDSFISVQTPRLLAKAFIENKEYIEQLESADYALNKAYVGLKTAEGDVKDIYKSVSGIVEQVESNADELFTNARLSINDFINGAQDDLEAQTHSARDHLDSYLSRREKDLSKLVVSAKNEYKDYVALMAESFNEHEEASINRIQVFTQKAENIGSSITRSSVDTQREVKATVTEQLELLNSFAEQTQSTVNKSLRKTTSESTQKIQDAQTEAQTSFSEHVNKNINDINQRINEKVSSYDELKEKLEFEFKEKISVIEDQISIVTSGVMADQHIKQANTERNVYWALQFLGFMFMIAAIYSGSVFFSELTNIRLPFMPKPDLVIHIDGASKTSTDPTILMFMRLSMVILLTAPAIYLLKEAAVHRHKENLYRQRGIQLATISPYLEELEKSERAAIKKELVSSFFQFHDGKADTNNVPDFLRDVKEAANIAKVFNGQPVKPSKFGRNSR